MTENKPRTTPGARISPIWNLKQSAEFKAELQTMIEDRTKGRPLWGAGAFTRHIVVGFFEPISYCGRFVGDISTEPMPTRIGVVCPKCSRLWNRAMDARNQTIEAGNHATVTGYRARLVDLWQAGDLIEFRQLWRDEVRENRALRTALIPELSAHGVDVDAVLEQVRVELGEPERFQWPSK